jgi:hypothetical protein
MTFYMIRLKMDNSIYIGKSNPIYALVSDEYIKIIKGSSIECILKGPFMCKEKHAKIWTNTKAVKTFVTRCKMSKEDTFSQYEIEIHEDGKVSVLGLDDFIKELVKEV